MKLIDFETSYKKLILKNRPSKIIKSPYVGDAVDEYGKPYLVHMPGLGLGGQCVSGSKFYATPSSSNSKTDFTFQSVLLNEPKYEDIIIGGNPFHAEKVSKYIIKNKLIKKYSNYELIKKPKNYIYNGDLFIKNENEIGGPLELEDKENKVAHLKNSAVSVVGRCRYSCYATLN